MCVCVCVCVWVCVGVCVCADDDLLLKLLPLADEYQSEHVRVKCEAYIGHQLQYNRENLSSDRKLLYFMICEQYSLKKHWVTLLGLCSNLVLSVIVKSEYFNKMTLTAQSELLMRRCRVAEDLLERQQKAAKRLGTEVFWDKKQNVCGECNADPSKNILICKNCIEKVFKN